MRKDNPALRQHTKNLAESSQDYHYIIKDWKTGEETKYPDEQTATQAQIDASLEAKSAYRFTRYKVPGSM